jgi:two-component system, NtrC family, sensor kinase
VTTRRRSPKELVSLPAAPAVRERDEPEEDRESSSGEMRAVPRSDLLPKHRRRRAGRRIPFLEGGATDTILRHATQLPVERGPEAVARSVVDIVRLVRTSCAVGVVVPGGGEGGDPLYVTALPLELETAMDPPREIVDLPPTTSRRRDTDPSRLFPDRDDEWIVALPAPFEGTTLHVAGTLEVDGAPDAALQELVERAALILAVGLAGARRVREAAGDGRKLRDLQARIIQSEKLASIGQIAAQVVHELNNPLTAIVSYAEFLTRKLERGQHDPGDLERLRRIGESAQRILRFSRELTTSARPDEEGTGPVQMREIVERALVFCEHIVSEHAVHVRTSIDALTPSVVGRRGQLTQVFVNLVTNACHAIHDARREEGEISVQIAPLDGGGATVAIGDNGHGISPRDLVRVFDPFFTTKAAGRGTGLGLSIVRSIVEEHGGRVWVRSVVGAGTTFVVELPTSR